MKMLEVGVLVEATSNASENSDLDTNELNQFKQNETFSSMLNIRSELVRTHSLNFINDDQTLDTFPASL